jgi:hypothetical protein
LTASCTDRLAIRLPVDAEDLIEVSTGLDEERQTERQEAARGDERPTCEEEERRGR